MQWQWGWRSWGRRAWLMSVRCVWVCLVLTSMAIWGGILGAVVWLEW